MLRFDGQSDRMPKPLETKVVTVGSALVSSGGNKFHASCLTDSCVNVLRMVFVCLLALLATSSPAAPLPIFETLVAREIADDGKLLQYYGSRGFRPIWTADSPEGHQRLSVLFETLEAAPSHGLPYGQIQSDELRSLLAAATTQSRRAIAEVRATRIYLTVAEALAAGAINPKSVDSSISRTRPIPATEYLLDGLFTDDPASFVLQLAPMNANYAGLRKRLQRLEALLVNGGWGSKVDVREIGRDMSGQPVVQLRNRLIRMGYLRNSASTDYNDALMFAVKRFEVEHGLDPDGLADRLTIEAINVEPWERRQQVLAALERARWKNFPLGIQHVLVNLPDFRASIIRDGKPVFESRVVVGKTRPDLQTPEFSDVMTHMIVNPTWWLPRSISTGEILPKLKQDPMAEPQLVIFEPETGNLISRTELDFSEFTASNFPFEMRQPPGPDNALGRVKFMFPNKFNVYLHDTPWRALFERQMRSFSHGCIRVHRAHDLARFLLGMQSDRPDTLFEVLLATGDEFRIDLEEPLPLHITYQTVWVDHDGRTNFRTDIYGRDQLIYGQLVKAGLDAGLLSN